MLETVTSGCNNWGFLVVLSRRRAKEGDVIGEVEVVILRV